MLRPIAVCLAFCLFATAGAFACWICNDLTGKFAVWDPVLTGSEICVTGQPNQSCSLYYECDNCEGDPDCGCPPDGCPADRTGAKLEVPRWRGGSLLRPKLISTANALPQA